MSTAEILTNREYKYGWVTDIESETIPRGLSEDTVRLISAKKNEPAFAKYGYSLTSGLGPTGELVRGGKRGDAIIGPLYCCRANAWALIQRIGMHCKWYGKRKIRPILPEFVVTRTRQARQRESFGKT